MSEIGDVHALERLRPVGHLERYSCTRHHMNIYNNVSVAGLYDILSAPQERKLDLKPLVFAALRLVLERHPMLFVVPVDEGTKSTYIARLPSINLERAVTFLPPRPKLLEEDLDKILEEQHNTDHKASYGAVPFWRIVVVDTEEGIWIAWFYHHVVGDGTSGKALLRSLLTALNDVETTTEADPIVVSKKEEVKPSQDDVFPLPISFGFLMKEAFNEWVLPSSFSRRDYWSGERVVAPSEAGPSRYKTLHLSPETTSALLQACKRHRGITITSLLEAILAKAIFTVVSPDQGNKLVFILPVTLRRWIPSVTDDDVGTWVTTFDETFSRSASSNIWGEAERCKKTLDKIFDGKGKNTSVGLLKFVGDQQKYFEGKVGKKRDEAVLLSNIGVVDGRYEHSNESPAWMLKQATFSQSCCRVAAAFDCNVVTVKGRGMALVFGWAQNAVREEDVIHIVEEVRKNIDQAMEE